MTWKHFCVTGPLCGESICHLWILFTKDRWRGALMYSFMYTWTKGWTILEWPVLWDAATFIWRHCNVIRLNLNSVKPSMRRKIQSNFKLLNVNLSHEFRARRHVRFCITRWKIKTTSAHWIFRTLSVFFEPCTLNDYEWKHFVSSNGYLSLILHNFLDLSNSTLSCHSIQYFSDSVMLSYAFEPSALTRALFNSCRAEFISKNKHTCIFHHFDTEMA